LKTLFWGGLFLCQENTELWGWRKTTKTNDEDFSSDGREELATECKITDLLVVALTTTSPKTGCMFKVSIWDV
jgi:predicted acyl esterase